MSKKTRRNAVSIKSLFGVIVLLVLGCIFIFESLQCLRVINNCDNAILEYQGQYTYSEEHYWRNVSYQFVLENGDILTIPSEHIVNVNLENYPALLFKYSSSKSLFALGKHRLLSLQSQDGSCVFVEEDTTTQEMHLGAVSFMIIGISCLLISLLPFLFSVLVFFAKVRSPKYK